MIALLALPMAVPLGGRGMLYFPKNCYFKIQMARDASLLSPLASGYAGAQPGIVSGTCRFQSSINGSAPPKYQISWMLIATRANTARDQESGSWPGFRP